MGTVGLHGISLETLTSMAWNIPRPSSRSSVPLKIEEEAKCLAGRGEFACSSHVCRNVRLGSLVEHCSIFYCLFGHVLLIAIDLIFLQNHREPSTVLLNHREPFSGAARGFSNHRRIELLELL